MTHDDEILDYVARVRANAAAAMQAIPRPEDLGTAQSFARKAQAGAFTDAQDITRTGGDREDPWSAAVGAYAHISALAGALDYLIEVVRDQQQQIRRLSTRN